MTSSKPSSPREKNRYSHGTAGFKGKKRFEKPRGEQPAENRFGKDNNRSAQFKKSRRDDYQDVRPRGRDNRNKFPKNKPRNENVSTVPAPKIDSNNVLIWGLHAVRAAWLNPKRRCFRLWITESAASGFEAVITEARDNLLLKRPDPKRVERPEIERLLPPGSVHQGIVLEMLPLPEPSLHDLISGDAPPDLLIMLDQVTDPHNVGAILRSAAAFGAGGVIMTERNAPGTTGVLAKAASGALEFVPQIHVVNLARALDELQQAGYWSVGLAEEGTRDLYALDLTGRTVIVMGAEGEGLRQLTRKKCDELARLPTGGEIGSLNVSNAAAIALYEVRRQKKLIA